MTENFYNNQDISEHPSKKSSNTLNPPACNLCGHKDFEDMDKRIAVKCSRCGSLERTRLMKLYLDQEILDKDTKVLHIAPERGLYAFLAKKLETENYLVADFDPSGYSFTQNCLTIDLCNMDEWQSDQFDFIIHSHVLEHTPCNIAYSMFHLSRILKNSGKQICVIPFSTGVWDEKYSSMKDEQRIERFGQEDHVRLFGRNDIPLSLGKVIKLPEAFDAEKVFGAEILRQAAIPEREWRGFHGSTILQLNKNDYLLK